MRRLHAKHLAAGGSNSMIRAIGIGDNVCDKYLHLGRMFPGGQALNFAVQCRMAGCESAYIGVCGSDRTAQHIRFVLNELGVDTAHLRSCDGENGYAIVDLKDGERVFVRSNKGGVLRAHPIELSPDDLDYIASFDAAHTSNNSYIDPQLPLLGTLNTFLSYDFSQSWRDAPRARAVCAWVDAGFFSCSDCADDEARDLLTRAYADGCPISVATRGERGALAYDGVRFHEHRPAALRPLDTLGAGDAFAAGFIMTYVERREGKNFEPGSGEQATAIRAAFERAGALSAKTCKTYGAFGYGVDIE